MNTIAIDTNTIKKVTPHSGLVYIITAIPEILGENFNLVIKKNMNRFHKLNYDFTVFLTKLLTITLYLTKEQSETTQPKWLGIILILIFTYVAKLFPKHFFSNLLRVKIFRKIFFGKKLLEGYWYITDCDSECYNSIVEITYDSSLIGYRIMVSQLDKNGELIITTSEYVHPLQKDDNRVLNLFLNTTNDNKVESISSGQFSQSDPNKLIDTYSGHIVTLNDARIIKQKGNRISEAKVNYYIDQFDKDWKIALIRESVIK